jgi:hypothetical protein
MPLHCQKAQDHPPKPVSARLFGRIIMNFADDENGPPAKRLGGLRPSSGCKKASFETIVRKAYYILPEST